MGHKDESNSADDAEQIDEVKLLRDALASIMIHIDVAKYMGTRSNTLLDDIKNIAMEALEDKHG